MRRGRPYAEDLEYKNCLEEIIKIQQPMNWYVFGEEFTLAVPLPRKCLL
jgi:hypothetical protein